VVQQGHGDSPGRGSLYLADAGRGKDDRLPRR
jgi:hypothetical protein